MALFVLHLRLAPCKYDPHVHAGVHVPEFLVWSAEGWGLVVRGPNKH